MKSNPRPLGRPGLLATLLLLAVFLLLMGPHSVAQTPGSGASSQDPTPTRSGAGTEEELETFVPTEKVPADSGVAFPVDI